MQFQLSAWPPSRRAFQRTLALGVIAMACLPVGAEPPSWSNHGPAEREFKADFVMFAEHREDTWHAWIPSYWGDSDPTAHEPDDANGPRRTSILEFFSGKIVEGLVRTDEMGNVLPEFTSLDGVMHVPAGAEGPQDMRSKSLMNDWNFRDLAFTEDRRLDPYRFDGCDTDLTVVDKISHPDGSALWSRLILDYSPPTARCPHGVWSSQPRAVLDLQDGTFLAALNNKVVRLSFSDLSPIGTGASVRIVDAETVHEIISAGGDMHALLNRALSNTR